MRVHKAPQRVSAFAVFICTKLDEKFDYIGGFIHILILYFKGQDFNPNTFTKKMNFRIFSGQMQHDKTSNGLNLNSWLTNALIFKSNEFIQYV